MTIASIKLKVISLSALLRKVFSLMGKREIYIAWVLVLVLALDFLYYTHAAYMLVTNPQPAVGGRYREGVLGQPRLINPLVGTSQADQSLIRLVYSGLYKYDNNGKIAPDLATSLPEISEDQKQYKIHLREDALWHNNKRVTAEDVTFTVHTIQNPEYNSPLRNLWQNTVVTNEGEFTVLFTNEDVSAPFIHSLTLPILPAAVWASVPANQFLLSSQNLEAVGSGPYTIREIKKLPDGTIQSIKLESFSNYYAGKPYIDTITTLFYETYEDLVSSLHAKLIDGFGYISLDTTLSLNTDRNDIHLYKLPLPQYQGAFFNLKHPILNDVRVRNALSLSTDRNAILHEVFTGGGIALAGPILPEQLPELPKGDIPKLQQEKAAELLDQAGWKLLADGKRYKQNIALEFTITTNDFPLNAKTAEVLANQWKNLGANIRLNIVPTKDLTGNILPTRGYDVLVFAVKLSPDPDPFVLWHSSQAKDPGLNITQFTNSEVDKLISEGRNTTNIATRIEKYTRFQEILQNEVPAIFLSQTVYVYAMHTKVKGVTLRSLHDQSFRFTDTTNWYIEEKRVWR